MCELFKKDFVDNVIKQLDEELYILSIKKYNCDKEILGIFRTMDAMIEGFRKFRVSYQPLRRHYNNYTINTEKIVERIKGLEINIYHNGDYYCVNKLKIGKLNL